MSQAPEPIPPLFKQAPARKTALGNVVQCNPQQPEAVMKGEGRMGVVLASQIVDDSVYVVPAPERRHKWRGARSDGLPVQNGDVVLPARGHASTRVATVMLPLAGQNRANAEYAFSYCQAPPGYLVLRPDPARLLGAFLAHYLRLTDWPHWRTRHQSILAALRLQKLALPPLAAQRAWVAALEQAQQQLTQASQALDACDQERRQAFTRFFGSTLSLRERWPQARLGELVPQILHGRAWRNGPGQHGPWRVLTPDHLRWNRLHPAPYESVQGQAGALQVQAGDVLLTRACRNACAAPAPAEMADTVIGTGLVILRGPGVLPDYLAAYLCSGTGLGEIERVADHGRANWLSREAIGNIMLPLPPPSCQATFVQQRRELDLVCAAALGHWQNTSDRVDQLQSGMAGAILPAC